MRKYFELGEYFVTSSPENNTLKIINQMGRFILESLDAGVTKKIISEDIANVFNLSFEKAKKDVNLFLQQYNKAFAINTPPSSLLEKRKVAFMVPCKQIQIAIFPSFSLKISHANKESFALIRPLFQHLEAQVSNYFVADYSLHIQKNKAQQWEIIEDKEIIFSGARLDEIIIPAISYILELAIRKAPYLILLHASGVTYKNSSIIFPAIGGSGKSTLCAALIQNGFGYINDDVIPVTYGSGELISIPFCLGIKQGSWSVLDKYYPGIAERYEFERNNLKIKYLPPPKKTEYKKTYKAHFLVIPCYKKESLCSLEKTSSINGLKAIIEGESLMKLPLTDNDIESLLRWVENLECYKLKYNNLEEAIRILKETLFVK